MTTKDYSSTVTICCTRLIMPRTSGVSSSPLVRCILLRPRPTRVLRWCGWRRIGDPVWVILILAICLLRHRLGFRLGLGAALAGAPAHQVGDLLAAALRHRFGAGLLAQRLERRPHHVVGVGRADRLGDDVGNAEALEHGAHRSAGDDAGARRSGADVDAAGAEMAHAVMMEGAALAKRHAHHRLLGGGGGLGDRLGHLAGLAVAEAGAALAVADDDQSGEAEALAALHGLRDAVDVDELLDQLLAAVVVASAAA